MSTVWVLTVLAHVQYSTAVNMDVTVVRDKTQYTLHF